MSSLAHQRCFNHSQREAAARCPECRQFFCRECITEHDDRVICAGCLKKEQTSAQTRRPVIKVALRLFLCLITVIGLWFFFFSVGDMLLSLPTSFHEGSVWQTHTLDK